MNKIMQKLTLFDNMLFYDVLFSYVRLKSINLFNSIFLTTHKVVILIINLYFC